MGAFLPKLGLAAIAALAISGTANAAVTITGYTAGQLAVPGGGQLLVDNFDGFVRSGFTFSGGTIFSGTQPDVHDAPTGDLTNYVAVLGNAPVATLTVPTTIAALSFYVGSVDNFNSVNFYNTANVLVSTITGTQLRTFAGGSSTVDVADGRFFFDLSADNIGKITFSSTSNSFELDNIAASVPEPGVWAMMLLGMGGLGYALRRRRFAAGASAATA